MPRDRDDRPRQRVRRLRLLHARPRPPGSSRSSASRPTSRPAPRARAQAACAGTTAATTTSPARGAYTHMTLLAETTEGMHNLFRLSTGASARGLLLAARAWTASCSPSTRKGLIGTTGCPSGEVQIRLRLGEYDEARQAAADFQDIFGKENYFLELMDHGLDIESRVRDDLLRLAKDLGDPAGRDQRLALRPPARTRAAHERLLCVASGSDPGRPQAVQVRRRRLLPQVRRRDARAVGRPHDLPEACDNTLLIAERCEVEFTEGNGTYMPRFPCPPGENEDSWFVKEVERGLQAPLPGRHPRRRAQAGRLRDRRHHPDGLPGLLPRRRRLHQLGQGQRHPGRPRPRLGCRLDGAPTRCASPTSTRCGTA